MEKDKIVIFLFTESFPFGKGESFLESEIDFANKIYDFTFFPLSNSGVSDRSHKYQSQTNYKIDNSDIAIKIPYNFSNLHSNLKIIFSELLFSRKPFAVLLRMRELMSILRKAQYLACILSQEIKSVEKKPIFYSFWMNDWALALAILKKNKKIDSFVFRVLGYDIYDERHRYNYLPFRNFIYSQCKSVFAVSQTSMNYLIKKNMYQEKITYAYLGTNDFGLSPCAQNAEFLIVSCSRLIPLKRVHLIPEILKHLKGNIKWIHIGSGQEESLIKSKINAMKVNIECQMLPHFVEHSDLVKFYLENSVDLFLHVSESEGLGVVHLEALSFGIPVYTTEVGGASEFITEINGKLFPVDFNTCEVASYIQKLIDGPRITQLGRETIKKSWKETFESTKVYSDFYREILIS